MGLVQRRLEAVALAALLAGCGAPAPGGDGPTVTIGDDVVRVEVARTPEERARGLSGREALGPDEGMIFPFETAGHPGFWMQGMRFDLDLVWVRDGRIVEIHERVPRPPPGPDPNAPPLPLYRPRTPADLVLEVPAGSASRRGWEVGDRLEIDPPLAPSPGPASP